MDRIGCREWGKQSYFVVRKDDINGYIVLCCQIELPSSSISLNSLKKLTLRRVYMNEQMIERLIGERHLLEDLYISGCSGFKAFECLQSSQTQDYDNCGLSVKRTQNDCCSKSLTVNLQNGHCPGTFFASKSEKVNSLWLVLKDQEFHWLISKFPWLEDLSVMRCFFIERIMISSGLLKHLLIEFCESFKAVDLGIPNLLSFTFESTQIPTISITTSQLCPWKVHFELKGDIDHWYLKLKEFLAASSQSRKIVIGL